MNRIADAFAAARSQQRACFISYTCAGDPDYETSLRVLECLVEKGVDIVEIGVPFSDPLADGLTNQLAADRALRAGMNQEMVFRLVESLREVTQTPVVLYTYYNLVFSMGIERYVTRAREAGVDGLLTLDLPPEEADELCEASRKVGMKNIFIIAPTTPPARMDLIVERASGFLYYVSREGVTGERNELSPGIRERIEEIRRHTDLPVVVGFGISKREHVRAVGAVADGAVVGSALVNCIASNIGDSDAILASLSHRLDELLPGLSGEEKE